MEGFIHMNEIADGIYDALYASSDVVGQVGGTPNPRIYRDLAPQGADLPYYVFQRSGGPGDINDTPKEAHEALYLVQGVTEVSPAAAGIMAGYSRTALHRVTLTVASWVNIWCACEGHVELTEIDQDTGRQSWRQGHFVRIRLAKST